MRSFHAILFDMDGVVADTERSVVEFWERVAAEQGVALTDDDFSRHIYGVTAIGTVRALFPRITPDQDDSFAERIARYEGGLTYAEVAGVGSLVRSLKAEGVPTALVTSGMGPKVAEVLHQLDLGGLFDVVITGGDVERGKPDPACYIAAAERLGVNPAACIAFEDAPSGVRSAVAAGATCVGIRSRPIADVLKAEGAVHIIPDFTSASIERRGDEVHLRLADGFVAIFDR